MEINLLCLNIGNTRAAVGAFSAGELSDVRRVALSHADDLAASIRQAWSSVAERESAAVAGACVNPPQKLLVEQAVRKATGLPVQWVGETLDIPIRNLTEEPEKTGVDRLLAAAAAYEQMQKACVVVDAGTAITVNCCNAEGAFVGGAIAPGVSLMLDALHTGTSALPRVQLAVPTGTVGRNTEQAIRHGVYHAARGMVKEVVENFATELGTWPDLIATGGDAAVLFGGWELVHAVSPDLSLYGIALAYAEHHIKHPSDP